MSPFFFIRWRKEREREREDGNGCCAPNAQESVCQGVSVLMMGSSSSFDSHGQARLSGKIENILPSIWSARLDSCQNRPGGGWDLTPLSFFAMKIEQGA